MSFCMITGVTSNSSCTWCTGTSTTSWQGEASWNSGTSLRCQWLTPYTIYTTNVFLTCLAFCKLFAHITALTKRKTLFAMMQFLSLGYCVVPTRIRKCKTRTERSSLHDIPVLVRLTTCPSKAVKCLYVCNFSRGQLLGSTWPTSVRLVHRNFFPSGLFHHLCDSPWCALKRLKALQT